MVEYGFEQEVVSDDGFIDYFQTSKAFESEEAAVDWFAAEQIPVYWKEL